MKTLLAFFLALLCLGSAARAYDPTSSPSKPPPFRGMTKAEAFARYGEPFHRAADGPNEQWFYHTKFAEVYGRAFVPFAFSSDNVRLGVLTFGSKGTITRYDWTRTDFK